MTKQKKPFGCPHTQTAQQNICNYNFTQFIVIVKATSFHLAVRIRVVREGF